MKVGKLDARFEIFLLFKVAISAPVNWGIVGYPVSVQRDEPIQNNPEPGFGYPPY